jgi:hypothetical protein
MWVRLRIDKNKFSCEKTRCDIKIYFKEFGSEDLHWVRDNWQVLLKLEVNLGVSLKGGQIADMTFKMKSAPLII